MCNRIYDDIAGVRSNRLVAIKFSGTTSEGYRDVLCKCDCGTIKVIRGRGFRSGKTQSCGCAQKEAVKLTGHLNTTHNMSRSPIYRVWNSMIQRCENPAVKKYVHYGGRGIKVCKRWHTFENFLADMGECPNKKLSLDRIDNNGHYTKQNCRWADSSTQNRNRRNSIWHGIL